MDLQLGELLKGAGNSLFPHLGAHASPSVQGASTQVEGRAALLEPSNPPPAPRPPHHPHSQSSPQAGQGKNPPSPSCSMDEAGEDGKHRD